MTTKTKVQRLTPEQNKRLMRLCKVAMRDRRRMSIKLHDAIANHDVKTVDSLIMGRKESLRAIDREIESFIRLMYRDDPEKLINKKGQDRTREYAATLLDMYAEMNDMTWDGMPILRRRGSPTDA